MHRGLTLDGGEVGECAIAQGREALEVVQLQPADLSQVAEGPLQRGEPDHVLELERAEHLLQSGQRVGAERGHVIVAALAAHKHEVALNDLEHGEDAVER